VRGIRILFSNIKPLQQNQFILNQIMQAKLERKKGKKKGRKEGREGRRDGGRKKRRKEGRKKKKERPLTILCPRSLEGSQEGGRLSFPMLEQAQ
jgi:hypothetical protein